jgi:serine protease Do
MTGMKRTLPQAAEPSLCSPELKLYQNFLTHPSQTAGHSSTGLPSRRLDLVARHHIIWQHATNKPGWACDPMKALVPLLFAVALVSGCATDPFVKYYQSYTNQMPLTLQRRLLPPSGTPQLVTTSGQGHKDEARRLEERGFVILGSSRFWGFKPTQEQLVRQAKKVGADAAVWAFDYSHTEEGVRPLFSYQPGQTYTTTHSGTATANVYGSAGYAHGSGAYSGYSTTTTPGTMTTHYVPYQQRVYNHEASFWRRMKPAVFGANFGSVPEELRITLQRNTGAYVTRVIIDGPAFKANLMPGDVIVQIADTPVTSYQELLQLLPRFAGQKVALQVLRGPRTLAIDVQLNPEP